MSSPQPFDRVTPVEYKRSRPKTHRADEVQLCAQALCLEEMTDTPISLGSLYYGKNRRRKEVTFDQELRRLTLATATEVRDCLNEGRTPDAEYLAKRCDACSLIDHCQPKSLRLKRGAAAWFTRQLDL